MPPLQHFIHTSVECAGWMSCRLQPAWEPLAWYNGYGYHIATLWVKLLVCNCSLICTLRFMNFRLPSGLRDQAAVRGVTVSLLLHFQLCALNPPQPFILSFALCKRLLCHLYRYNFYTLITTSGKRDQAVVKILGCFLQGNTSHLHCLWK